MNVTPERFTSRPRVVTAVRLTPENLVEVAASCKASVKTSRTRNAVTGMWTDSFWIELSSAQTALVGDWVVIPPQGGFIPLTNDAFNELYERERITRSETSVNVTPDQKEEDGLLPVR